MFGEPSNADMTPLEHELTNTLRVVLETRNATFAAIAAALRKIERRLLATAADVNEQQVEAVRIRAEVLAAASAIAAVASLVETPLTATVVGEH